ncbi:MAG: hypothetical protein ACT4OG_06450 [Alphaproteobacteria bacterium]
MACRFVCDVFDESRCRRDRRETCRKNGWSVVSKLLAKRTGQLMGAGAKRITGLIGSRRTVFTGERRTCYRKVNMRLGDVRLQPKGDEHEDGEKQTRWRNVRYSGARAEMS